MILGSVTLICSILGIVGYFTEHFVLLTICGIINILCNVLYSLLKGQFSTLITDVIASIIGYFITKHVWYGIALGLCIDYAITGIFLIIITMIGIIGVGKSQNFKKGNKK